MAQALSAYADHQASALQAISPADYAKEEPIERQNVKEVVTQFTNAIMNKDQSALVNLMYYNSKSTFPHPRWQPYELIELYHDRSKTHDMDNFEIDTINFNQDLTRAGVQIRGYFRNQNNDLHIMGEGWVFKRDVPSGKWQFDDVAYPSEYRQNKKDRL